MDIITYLKAKNIIYYEQGKNVTFGWVNIQCPFCIDHSNHLGINLESKWFNCWICGEKGPIEKLIGKIENTHSNILINNVISKKEVCEFPKYMMDKWEQYHYDYLIKRRFNLEEIKRKYKLKFCNNTSSHKFSIIIPVILNDQIVNFSSVNVFTRQYRHCSNNNAVIPIKHCLYNIDTVGDTVVIVEGITDVWRMGAGTVATFGLEYTKEQVYQLSKKHIRNVFVMYDSEPQAVEQAEKLCQCFDTLPGIEKTELLILPYGDPADMLDDDVRNLKIDIFGQNV